MPQSTNLRLTRGITASAMAMLCFPPVVKSEISRHVARNVDIVVSVGIKRPLLTQKLT
jgi:hypothetical protein